MNMPVPPRRLFLAALRGFLPLFAVGALVVPVAAEETKAPETQYRMYDREIPKENLFDITFGSPPPLATERGILIIDAYLDVNGNQRRDPEDTDLVKEITCHVGELDYPVPAFIPGLAYNETHAVNCSGERFQPSLTEKDVFVERRGQVIRVDLPCRAAAVTKTSSTPPAPSVSRQP
jgi:hypothetical protein